MTWRRIGSSGSFGSIRLMKYGVMSTRNFSGAERPSRSSSVRFEDLLDLLEVVDPVAQLPAPVVPLLVGDVRPERGASADRGPSVRTQDLRGVRAVDERRPRPPRGRRPGGRRRTGSRGHPTLAGLRWLDRASMHRKYASCKSADDSAMVPPGSSAWSAPAQAPGAGVSGWSGCVRRRSPRAVSRR